MRTKISVTIDETILRAIDRAAAQQRCSRSCVLEDAARDYLAQQPRRARSPDSADRQILDRVADALNLEMKDVLSYQHQSDL